MSSKKLVCFVFTLICLVLTACSSKTVAPGNYDSSEVGKVKKVVSGTIISARSVNIHNKAAEATANNASQTMDTADNSEIRNHGYEYVIRLNSGAIISLVQSDSTKLKPKQHVLVIYGDNTRVVADDGDDDY